MKEFVENTLGYKVLTPSGYREFAGVAMMGIKPVFRVEFSEGQYLECTDNHKLFTPDGETIQVSSLNAGDAVSCRDGRTTAVTSIQDTGRVEPVYDLIEVDGGHRYFANGVLSSNCEFVTDDETLIEPMCLSRLSSMEPEFYTGQVRWFKEPEANKTYLVGLDPSLGTGGDPSAIQVFELPGMIQVAEWQNNKTPPRSQVKLLLHILNLLDSELRDQQNQDGDPVIYWTVENNTLGEAILQVIEDTGEHMFPGVFISEKRKPGASRRFRKGLNTNNTNKLSACAKFKSLIESDRMIVNSNQLLRQLKNFVSHGGSFAAKQGEKDDLVMSAILCVRMLETVIFWMTEEESQELKESISGDDDFDDPMPTVIG